MGSTRWSNDQYRDRARRRALTGRDAFEYDHAVRQGEVERGVHAKMDPRKVKLRESRDSDAHPESRSVAVLFDVTGSMQTVPRILQANLPRLMNLLIDGRYLDHPQVLIGAIGDATCDAAPLQIGQFESGVEIEDDLGRLYLEGGGGGHNTESYELAMYFMARHTAIDCWEKRGQRGYLFLIGDEIPYPRVKRKEAERWTGDRLQHDLSVEKLMTELRQRYDVYYVLPRMTAHWDDAVVQDRWTELLGQNMLRLEDPAGVCELIASTIGVAEGRVDMADLTDDLEGAGTSAAVAQAVRRALGPR